MDGAGHEARSESGPDHGGGIDAAAVRFGGARADWIDLSTGINPVPYPVPRLPPDAWTALPDQAASAALEAAARALWQVPPGAAVLAAPGASALIARIPALAPAGRVAIPGPTYNEHARAFRLAGWQVADGGPAEARVVVHPNNPDGRRWADADPAVPGASLPIVGRERVGGAAPTFGRPPPPSPPHEGEGRRLFDGLAHGGLLVVDESFADAAPEAALTSLLSRPNTLILKSLGKFWGLAGLRLGFALGDPGLVARLSDLLGPWPVSGPALAIGAAALKDRAWAAATRARLTADSARLDALMTGRGANVLGGTTLFRLYDVADARAWQDRLARSRIWTRTFPYNPRWLRLGLPAPSAWPRLEAAL